MITLAASAQESKGRELGTIRKTVRGFSKIDTNYIEPQHYEYTVMLQSTSTYDMYKLRSANGQSITLAPDVVMKFGPYVGWRWFFLGYTFDLKNIGFSNKGQKRELEFSIYSSQIGIDLFYRRTGSDYKIRDVYMGKGVDASAMDEMPFDGVNVGITGVNLYYIFNHRKFSYPAAFAQSTCQKLSCGSWIAGVGYTRNSLSLDYGKLQKAVEENCTPNTVIVDSGLLFNDVKYYDINLSGGYAYNWVFAKHWLFCVSSSLALAYKRSKGDATNGSKEHGFSFNNLNVDGIGRFGLVYNNTKWYAGASAIVHSYNYRRSRFAANNTFGCLNIYAGVNFGLKNKYKKK
jgi:hypothetical protein